MRKFLAPLLTFALLAVVAALFIPGVANSATAPTPTTFSLLVNCGPTDSQGYCTVTHNLGVVPTSVQAQAVNYTALITTRNWTATTLQVRLAKRINSSNTVDPWANVTAQVVLQGIYTPATVTTSPTGVPPVSPTVVPPTTTPATTAPPTTTAPPVTTDYPTATTTGVPDGTTLTTVSGNLVITTANTVVDSKKVTGDVDVRAAGVVIKNSEIAGKVVNDNISTHNAFTIQDSTVGPASGCSGWLNGGIGVDNYTALRVKLRNFSDGFRISGSNISIKDNFVTLCGTDPSYHSDGIQAYGAGAASNIVIDHNVIDQRPVIGEAQTAPLFIPNDNEGQANQGIHVTSINNNVLASGGYSLRVFVTLPFTVDSISGNKIVDGTYAYGPVDVNCSRIAAWSGNATVTYDWANGKVLSQVRNLDSECATR